MFDGLPWSQVSRGWCPMRGTHPPGHLSACVCLTGAHLPGHPSSTLRPTIESNRVLTPRSPRTQDGMTLVAKTGGARVILRDVLRRPLAEVEIGAAETVVRRLSPTVVQAYCGIRTSIWSYNPRITAWEPVIEPWDLIVKLDANSSNVVRPSVRPSVRLSVSAVCVSACL
jgi:hypothetical protein